MSVTAFEQILKMNRSTFRFILDNNLQKVYYDDELIDFKDWIIRECFRCCTNEFEEKVVVENLKEEFEDVIKENRKAE